MPEDDEVLCTFLLCSFEPENLKGIDPVYDIQSPENGEKIYIFAAPAGGQRF
jgi:hypothetical protein